MEENVRRIRESKEKPIIGVIGATSPGKEYDRQIGIDVGYRLRQYVNERGSIFTGGVEGVGADAYAGVIKYCIEDGIKNGRMPDDKFFALIPAFTEIEIGGLFGERKKLVPYRSSNEYCLLSYLSSDSMLDKVIAGNNMEERRVYVGAVADILIMINGGPGTMDEAEIALKNSKNVIALGYTGGAAETLLYAKKLYLEKGMADSILGINNAVFELVHEARSVDEMIDVLCKINYNEPTK